MERDTSKDAADILSTRPNGRNSAPLVINRNGSRKDLFSGKQQSKENSTDERRPPNGSHSRSTSASFSAEHGPTSPNSRIPRPSSNSPRPFSIQDAYRMATEADEVGHGSPSPAPRTWRPRLGSGAGTNKAQKSPSLGQGPRRRGSARTSAEALGREDTVSSLDSIEARAHEEDDSDSDIDQKIKQFGRSQQLDEGHEARPGGGKNGLFANSRLGPKVAETGNELSKKASNGSLDTSSSSKGYKPWGLKAKSSNGWLKRVMLSPEKRGNDGVSYAHAEHEPISAPTPNKSLAWDADADFTAGDLFVSNSPPVKTMSSTDTAEFGRDGIPSRPRNSKIDEIRALEIEAALKYPDDPPEPSENDSSGQGRRTETGISRTLGRTNTKLDEIRAREIETLSKRAVATARLDEIRERNSETRSRSSSPEIPRKPSRDASEESPSADARTHKLRTGGTLEDGERIPDTPVTILGKLDAEANKDGDRGENKKRDSQDSSRSGQSGSISREDSHDLLRRLARAASASPAPEQQEVKSGAKDAEDLAVGQAKDGTSQLARRRERNTERTTEKTRSVGFAGLRREPSTESEKSDKRSSLAASDNDPTERIEREMQLFAPMDNHSERGSIRAPSPDSEKEDTEETPRPARIDPLTQPTPKVVGAYVETPATVKVERLGDVSLPEIVEPSQVMSSSAESVPGIRGRKAEIASQHKSQTLSAGGDRDSTRAKSRTALSRRARSLSRQRPPLINSARPPSVKDDLLEIQRSYQIEDSTLDDLDGFFSVKQNVSDTTSSEQRLKPEDSMKVELSEPEEFPVDEYRFKTINRIGRSLESIRTARRGIERLEDEVSKAKEAEPRTVEPKSEPTPQHPLHTHPKHIATACPVCLDQSPTSMFAYVHIKLPVLWQRKPRFKLTILGVFVFALTFWYLAETTMCSIYCKPLYCYPGRPCDWSYDDPFWGYAIPVKLDQWTTGGQGRTLVRKVRPDLSDWIADVWDSVTGIDITTVDTRAYDFEQRRQHRRRLVKKGLIQPAPEWPEDSPKYEAWRLARIAREEADARREMGYDIDEDESMTADERVSSR